MKIIPKCIKSKRHLCASGSILLPLAQKWGLVGVVVVAALSVFGAQSVSAASLSISIPSNLSVDVTPGGEAKEGKSVILTVSSDAYWGYSLGVKANSTDGALVNGTSKIDSIGDGITTLNQFGSNTWGYKVSGGGIKNNDYRKSPTTTESILDTTTGNSGVTETGNYEFALAAKIDNTQPAGTYSGSFTFTATANYYTVNYLPNANDTVSNLPHSGEQHIYDTSLAIPSTEPTRDKYVFMGWCDKTPTKVEGVDTCKDGTQHNAGETYKVSSDSRSTTLTAMWGLKMQNWDGCAAQPEADISGNNQITLVDSRDKKLYYVAKLADNNCWMTENLDLDIIAGHEYTAADTDLGFATEEDIPSGAKTDKDGKYIWIPEKSTYESNITTWAWHDANGDYIAQSYNPGDYCWKGLGVSPSGSDFFNSYTVSCTRHQDSNNANPHYHVGNYYNYGALVAQNNTSGKKTGKYNTSICPSGWQLPTSDSEPSYQSLKSQIDSKYPNAKLTSGASGTVHKAPYYFTYTDYWRGRFMNTFGTRAHYWTNTLTSDQKASYFTFNSAGTLSTNITSGDRPDGAAVRCVARGTN